MESSLLEVREEGMQVELMDGSIWTIHPEDIEKTIKWRPIQRIIVQADNDERYPFLLMNLDTAAPETVRASRYL